VPELRVAVDIMHLWQFRSYAGLQLVWVEDEAIVVVAMRH